MVSSPERGTIVIITHNRSVQLLRTLRALSRLGEGWPIIVVDNGSTDETAKVVAREFPKLLLIRSRRNLGAAARNIAVAFVHTPYVAFCDDDTQWQPKSLTRAADVLDGDSRIGIVSAQVLIGETARVDPACVQMANSQLDRDGLPGPQLLDFMAGACVARTRAFYDAGGYWPPLFFGGEALLALDLAVRGWRLVYIEDVVVRHFPRRLRHGRLRERLRLRNGIWVAWLRLPATQAWQETAALLRRAHERRLLPMVLVPTLAGMLQVLKERHVITPRVAAMRARLFSQSVTEAPHELQPRTWGPMA